MHWASSPPQPQPYHQDIPRVVHTRTPLLNIAPAVAPRWHRHKAPLMLLSHTTAAQMAGKGTHGVEYSGTSQLTPTLAPMPHEGPKTEHPKTSQLATISASAILPGNPECRYTLDTPAYTHFSLNYPSKVPSLHKETKHHTGPHLLQCEQSFHGVLYAKNPNTTLIHTHFCCPSRVPLQRLPQDILTHTLPWL